MSNLNDGVGSVLGLLVHLLLLLGLFFLNVELCGNEDGTASD